jgi:hypothetical protein
VKVCMHRFWLTFNSRFFTSYKPLSTTKCFQSWSPFTTELVDQKNYFIYICNKMPWFYVTKIKLVSSLIHASDWVDGHILPHTTQDTCNKRKPSTQHSPARGQYTSKTRGQTDRKKIQRHMLNWDNMEPVEIFSKF